MSYAHFSITNGSKIHKQLVSYLKPGATIIFEGFSKDQLNYESGGPKDERMLFSMEEIKNEIPNVNFKELRREIITLNEGAHHQDQASVIRFTGELIEY